ncbi:MAG: aminopeptidase P family N-terminal domain-containing protein, partial [Sphingomonadaceae bacterium]
MTQAADRLAALRAELSTRGLDGFIVPLTDEHSSEYVGAYARRLEWLTGFAGSAGTAVVLAERAALFVDGRYTLQVRQQVPAGLYEYRQVPGEPLEAWLAEAAPAGARIGHDPWLHTKPGLKRIEAALAKAGRGAALVAVDSNPVDSIWPDRPAPSDAPAEALPDAFAGRSSADKRREIGAAIAAAGADAAVIAALDSIAWLFNIRGADVPRTPVVRAFALVGADGRATLFAEPAKFPPEVRAHLGDEVALEPYAAIRPAIEGFTGRLLLDPAWCVAALFEAEA